MTSQPTLLLNDGYAMPRFGLGVWQMPEDETERLVGSAIAQGYRAVDTAKAYGNEAGVGRAVRATDETIFVTTKLWNSDQGHDKALRAFDRSFDELGLDWIDLYLMHWPVPQAGLFAETWKALVRLKEEGRVRSIGVSNFTIETLERIIDDTGVIPAVNQVECHPRFQQVELRAFHEANGIATTSWSPLGRGGILDDPTIVAIADKHGRTPAQVTLRWHLENDLIVIPKSANPDRQGENLQALDFRLDAEDLERIAGLDRSDGRSGPDPDKFTMGLD
jgi:2,5-diketo-D-gluconate reductase A